MHHRYPYPHPSAGTAKPSASPLRLFGAGLALACSILLLSACGTGTTTAATQATGTTATTRAATSSASTAAPGSTTTAGQPSGSQQNPTGGIINMTIDAQEARRILDSNKNAILLDVRTIEENRAQRIPGSTLIPIQELADRLGELPKDPNRPILVYCRSGNRSAQAAAILEQAGFPAVYDFGGIIDWPYETERG